MTYSFTGNLMDFHVFAFSGHSIIDYSWVCRIMKNRNVIIKLYRKNYKVTWISLCWKQIRKIPVLFWISISNDFTPRKITCHVTLLQIIPENINLFDFPLRCRAFMKIVSLDCFRAFGSRNTIFQTFHMHTSWLCLKG